MNPKLTLELQRLFLLPASHAEGAPLALADAGGRVRAAVLGLQRAPDWGVLGRVWHGVQAELGLPAPGIAVSGVDQMQLWFSMAAPVPAAQAHAFLERLCQRFIADVEPRRLRLWPAAQGGEPPAQVPALQDTGNWSAFVAPDLAPVFGDTPWLDIEPNEEGQAQLLRVLAPIPPADFEEAMTALRAPDSSAAQAPAPAVKAPTPPEPAQSAQAQARAFLLHTMNDDSVALALRIEAARALLLQQQT